MFGLTSLVFGMIAAFNHEKFKDEEVTVNRDLDDDWGGSDDE